MQLSSIFAIYALFWSLCLFVVLPFHARTGEELGERHVSGHAESAPHRFPAGRVALRTTLLSMLLFGLYYANYVAGWISVDDLDWSR